MFTAGALVATEETRHTRAMKPWIAVWWVVSSLGCTRAEPPPPPEGALQVALTIAGGHFQVEGQSEPDLLVLPPNQEVFLTIVSTEGTPSLSIPDMDLRMTAVPRAGTPRFRTWACPREACSFDVLAWSRLGSEPARGTLRVVAEP